MPKKYSLQYDTQRMNPQFIGISQRYSNKRKERREVEDRKHSLQKSVNYVQKMKDTLDLTLQRKKDELAFLKSVRQRHLSDIKHKLDQEQKNNQKLEQLRMRSSNARISHQINLNNSLMSKKKQKLKAKKEVLEDLEKIKMLKQQQQAQRQELHDLRAKQQEEEKSIRGSRINKFYRNKNKFVLNSYRTMIKDQQLKSSKSKKEVLFLQTQYEKMNSTVSKKKQKLKSIQDQLQLLRQQSRQIKSINSFQWNSINQSRFSKKSSHPSQILKQSFSITATKKSEQ